MEDKLLLKETLYNCLYICRQFVPVLNSNLPLIFFQNLLPVIIALFYRSDLWETFCLLLKRYFTGLFAIFCRLPRKSAETRGQITQYSILIHTRYIQHPTIVSSPLF